MYRTRSPGFIWSSLERVVNQKTEFIEVNVLMTLVLECTFHFLRGFHVDFKFFEFNPKVTSVFPVDTVIDQFSYDALYPLPCRVVSLEPPSFLDLLYHGARTIFTKL